ncbi:MAG: glycogen debranching protein GlgX [Pseudomonadota bacterium]
MTGFCSPPWPLGATLAADGVHFVLYSAHGERVELCLFDEQGARETARIALADQWEGYWHGFVPGLGAGARYGYRVYGPYAPEEGHRFNPHKLLVDPCARALDRCYRWHHSHFAYPLEDEKKDLGFDQRDSAPHVPKGVVLAEEEGAMARMQRGWSETVLYEAHVKGLTWLYPGMRKDWRGTLMGLAAPAVTRHLKSLGVTALALMPVFPFADETHLARAGLTNYWGYNPINWFAVDPRYLGREGRGGARESIARLHDAGIEVILDVVFNHSGEGDHLGPTLSLRGIDNKSYYRLWPQQPRRYVNDTGCGNTLDFSQPCVLALTLASLRHWARLGIDGFRFDLATALGRDNGGFDGKAPLFQALAADPLLSKLKLIAEPWDLGPQGYRLGGFPQGWAEWNDRFRDDVRRYWRGDAGMRGALAQRLAGSSEIFPGKGPLAGVNFITAHDGFTLIDLTSYAAKHNEANGEGGRDGRAENFSANGGVEGPTRRPDVQRFRARQARNLVATLYLAQGVPMLRGGDEVLHSQQGNNNAYCQDNPISWIDWARGDRDFVQFVQALARLRNAYPALRRTSFFTGRPAPGAALRDVVWLAPSGAEMAADDWAARAAHCLGVFLAPQGGSSALLILCNAAHVEIDFCLPGPLYGDAWRRLVDTAAGKRKRPHPWPAGGVYRLRAHSLAVLAAS